MRLTTPVLDTGPTRLKTLRKVTNKLRGTETHQRRIVLDQSWVRIIYCPRRNEEDSKDRNVKKREIMTRDV